MHIGITNRPPLALQHLLHEYTLRKRLKQAQSSITMTTAGRWNCHPWDKAECWGQCVCGKHGGGGGVVTGEEVVGTVTVTQNMTLEGGIVRKAGRHQCWQRLTRGELQLPNKRFVNEPKSVCDLKALKPTRDNEQAERFLKYHF